MMIIPAKFQPSSSTGMMEKEVTDGHITSPHFPMIPKQKKTIMKILNF